MSTNVNLEKHVQQQTISSALKTHNLRRIHSQTTQSDNFFWFGKGLRYHLEQWDPPWPSIPGYLWCNAELREQFPAWWFISYAMGLDLIKELHPREGGATRVYFKHYNLHFKMNSITKVISKLNIYSVYVCDIQVARTSPNDRWSWQTTNLGRQKWILGFLHKKLLQFFFRWRKAYRLIPFYI